jgi:tryptophan-rich sensory protein
MKVNWFFICLGVAFCEFVGVLGSLAMGDPVGYYQVLNKPGYAPPSWVFAPVWLTLYALMGAGLGLVASSTLQRGKTKAYAIFGLQLFLNGIWSYLFFGLQSPLLGLIDIAALWVLIVASMWQFWRFSKAATSMLVPYILWVSIATSLNYFVFVLN